MFLLDRKTAVNAAGTWLVVTCLSCISVQLGCGRSSLRLGVPEDWGVVDDINGMRVPLCNKNYNPTIPACLRGARHVHVLVLPNLSRFSAMVTTCLAP
eukprot:gene13384-biopygen1988